MKKLVLFSLFLLSFIGCEITETEVVPLPPGNLVATVVSSNQVDLVWKDNSTNETGFKIERKTDAGSFTEIGTTSKDITTFSDQTVSLNTTYTYRVYSTNSVGKSLSYSNEASVRTATVPSLSTSAVTELTTSGAKSGGTVTSDGGAPVTARGVVWSTETAPTISLATKTSDGTGTGVFQSTLTTLNANTKYYLRAYATNSAGTSYGEELSFTTTAAATLPSITTVTVTEITSTAAKSGGSITADGNSPITARGVVWGTATNPTIALSTKTSNGTGSGAFQSAITGLAPNTKYYVRAYATNSTGTGYGNEFSFTTTVDATLPSITTVTVTEITPSGAKSGGSITADGNSPITARGVVWGTDTNPTIALSTKTSNGTGSGAFQSAITGLAANTKYYVRAYATNSTGTGYGNEFSFTTSAATLPSITTVSVTEITPTSAKSGGSITSNGSSAITAGGVIWNNSPENITIALSTKTSNVPFAPAFQTTFGPLFPFGKYYVRAYATNSSGTGYGQVIEFTTINWPPIFKPITVSQIATSSAFLFGNDITVPDANDLDIYGFVWSVSPTPTTALSTKTIKQGGVNLAETITGLSPNTKYYVRAYAKMIDGNTYYSNEISFTTLNFSLPTVLTKQITEITTTSAKSGGNVTSVGGIPPSNRGVVWSTSPNPTIALTTKTSNGNGNGEFLSEITGLSINTKYFVRAFATNSEGTAYGQELDFFTLPLNSVYGAGGRIWMDRNLGATRIATSSTDAAGFGDLYQWGRAEDGHQKRTSTTSPVKSTVDTPSSGNFITVSSGLQDWRNPANNNLWQGVAGINNPCPEGFRLPTIAEWNFESSSWGTKTIAEAFASNLKLPQAGSRDQFGNVSSFDGYYWTSTVSTTGSQSYAFRISSNSGSSGNEDKYRVVGASVRCIKNQ